MTPLLYSLHSGNLYGTERMALATIDGLRDEFDAVIIAPPGPIHDEAGRQGLPSIVFTSALQYAADIRPYFARNRRLVAVGTRVVHTMVTAGLATLYRNRYANLQIVHGGTDEHLSYGRKRWLGYLDVKQVAVSDYVRERLIAHGCRSNSVCVIENFLTRDRIESAIRRVPTAAGGLRKVVIVSRLDPIKRIDLLLDALDLDPELKSIEFEIYGKGEDEELLRSRALTSHPNVRFMGFQPDIPERLAAADLFLHLCPTEPFGLAILEAMAAGIPVLVPDQGGAGAIVQDERNGFRFRANDPWALARRLRYLQQAPAGLTEAVTAEGFRSLETRFSADCGSAQYRKLIHECLS